MTTGGLRRTLLLPALLACSGCQGNALSVAECQAIRNAELAYLQAQDPTGSLDPKWVADSSAKVVAKCAAGQAYTRKDYECMMSAQSSMAMSRCMAQAHEQAGR
jgi:hypothetical protein